MHLYVQLYPCMRVHAFDPGCVDDGGGLTLTERLLYTELLSDVG